MTKIIVSIDNYLTIDKIVNAIKMLKGVSDAQIWDRSLSVPVQQVERRYSDRINRLRSLSEKADHKKRLTMMNV